MSKCLQIVFFKDDRKACYLIQMSHVYLKGIAKKFKHKSLILLLKKISFVFFFLILHLLF